MERLSRVLFLMLCHLTCIAKQFVFHSDADKINQLVVGLDGLRSLTFTSFICTYMLCNRLERPNLVPPSRSRHFTIMLVRESRALLRLRSLQYVSSFARTIVYVCSVLQQMLCATSQWKLTGCCC